MKSNIVYQYLKKETTGNTIFIQADPITLKGSQLIIGKDGTKEFEALELESNFLTDLTDNGFQPASPLEFHILLVGLG